MNLQELFTDFISLIFPDICFSCQKVLKKGESKICTHCRANLPFTNIHKQNPKENLVTQKFYGKIPIEYGLAFLQFAKGGKVQNLLHQIKYNQQPELAEMLGLWYASELKEQGFQDKFDYIVPVPLHPNKLKIRGYNQSDYFGAGLSKLLEKELANELLQRNTNTSTQTKKSRLERWKNVSKIFEATNPDKIRKKSILLVDDVITTGSTLEACAQALLEAEAASISVASIAIA
ncbi:MAG: ComF family protein [Thermonemataceae bacterium]|nr:ComF family protein [Thermonemataceae bacterium]